VPTGRLALVAALGAVPVALFPGSSRLGFVVVDVAILLAALVDWWRAPAPGTVQIDRDLPAVVTLGQHASIAWLVENPTRRSLRVAFADQLAPSLHASRRRIAVQLPPEGRATAAASLRPSRRGRFAVDELVVRVEGPLGLMAKQARRTMPATLRVFPSFASRDEAELRINRARLLEIGLR